MSSDELPIPDHPEYCVAAGEDNLWLAGPFKTVEGALAEIGQQPKGYWATMRVHRVRYMTVGEWVPSVDTILEWMDDQANDNGYCSDGDPIFDTKEGLADAAEAALSLWAEKYLMVNIQRWVGDEVKPDERKPYRKPRVEECHWAVHWAPMEGKYRAWCEQLPGLVFHDEDATVALRKARLGIAEFIQSSP